MSAYVVCRAEATPDRYRYENARAKARSREGAAAGRMYVVDGVG